MPTPDDFNPDMQIGLTLPLVNGTNGYFQSSMTHLEQAKHNLKNLLLTVKGERPMQPELGCDIWKMVFEQNDDTIEARARLHIEDAINMWLPYLSIKALRVVSSFTEIDKCILHIEVEFFLTSDPDSYESISFDTNSFANF